MKSFSFNQQEQWNQAKGYLDEGERLWSRYNDASLTSGMDDDLEVFKRVVDWYSCKHRNPNNLRKIKKENLTEYYKESKGGTVSIMDWFLMKINEIEKDLTEISRLKQNSVVGNKLLYKASECKRKLRMLSREQHLVNEMLNLYDIEKAFHPKSLTDDIK